MYTINRVPLASDWNTRRADGYDVVVIGSGYGGAVTAARLATAQWPNARPTLCILERGKEWLPGQFPDRLDRALSEGRSAIQPLGLYDFHFGPDIGVIMGSGLGGTSLVNANAVIQPDREVFDNPQWPEPIRADRDNGRLQQFFDRVRTTLFAARHPDGMSLSKVKAMQKGAEGDPAAEFDLHDLAVNFQFEGPNHWGVNQRKCINCGDCTSGCNVGAKNTLDTNYLAIAKSGGAEIFTQVEVKRIEKQAGGGYKLHYLRRESSHGPTEAGTMVAKRIAVVAAGALGSTEIMLRSRASGLSLPDTVGTRFSGNGDFFGLAYNSDLRTDTLGWGAYPDSERARRVQPAPGPTLNPGPTIVSKVRYNRNQPLPQRVKIEDLSVPLMYVDTVRGIMAWSIGRDTDPQDASDNFKEFVRRMRDVGGISPDLEKGAMNYTLVYLVNGHDDAGGRMELNSLTDEVSIRWPGAGGQAVFQLENQLLEAHASKLGSTFVENPLWGFTPFRTLVTAHPLGGCPMGESHQTGLVNHQGQVYDHQGSLHQGLYIADAAVVPTSIGVNPFLTISAIAERRAEHLVQGLGGQPVIVQ